jgi:hypothetical protein
MVAIVGLVLLLSGSDGDKETAQGKLAVNSPTSVLSPAKVGSASEDLAATIANLNKSQLNMQAQVYGKAPLDVNLMDKQLTEISTNAMRTAELATVLSQTSANQEVGPPTPAAQGLSQQYAQIAQTAYGQVIEAQNQREGLAAGMIQPQEVAQTTASYGARMWNSGVTVEGISGNPFVPFFGAVPPPVDISISLSPGASATITTQTNGSNVSIWVANSNTFVTNTVWVRTAPVPIFDPFDFELRRRLLTLEGQSDPLIVRYVVLARLEQLRRLSLPGNLGPYINVVGYTDYEYLPWSGPYVNVVSPADYGNLPLNRIPSFTETISDWTTVPLYGVPTNGFMQLQMALPGGITLADSALVRLGTLSSYANGTATLLADRGSTNSSGTTAFFYNLNGDTAPTSVGQVLFNKAEAQSSFSGAVRVANLGPVSQGKAAVDLAVSLQVSGPNSASVHCGVAGGTSASGDVKGSGDVTLNLKLSSVAVPSQVTVNCSRVSLADIGDVRTFSVPIGDPKEASEQKRKFEDAQKQAAVKPLSPKASEAAKTLVSESKPVLAGSTAANSQDLNATAPAAAAEAASIATPPEVANAPAQVPVAPPRSQPVPQQPAVRPPAQQPAPPAQQPAPPAPAAPPPAPPAPATQRTCEQIIQAGRVFQNSAEGERFRNTCPGLPHTPQSCAAIEKLSTLQRTNAENGFYVSSCAIQMAQATPNPCTAGTLVDSGDVPGGVGSTKVPMDPRCRYNVCLSGTITGTKGGVGTAYSPTTALMRANGQAISSCITVSGQGGIVTFSCDGSKFVGVAFSGAFRYTVTRTGPKL